MSVPHCITFLLVPDPPPVWAASALELAPLRIVMGTLVTVQLQATDDNPDDSIQLESLTLPANMPSFVKITPGVEFCYGWRTIVKTLPYMTCNFQSNFRFLLV